MKKSHLFIEIREKNEIHYLSQRFAGIMKFNISAKGLLGNIKAQMTISVSLFNFNLLMRDMEIDNAEKSQPLAVVRIRNSRVLK